MSQIPGETPPTPLRALAGVIARVGIPYRIIWVLTYVRTDWQGTEIVRIPKTLAADWFWRSRRKYLRIDAAVTIRTQHTPVSTGGLV
jgi:hypothetical protein